ncbi:MAG: type IV secretion system protein [Pseudodesulfovibrio sp.]
MFRKFILTILLVICTALPVHASGMGVFDAVANMYNSMELEQMIAQVEASMEQLEFVEQATATAQKAYDGANMNYKRAKGVYDDLVKTKEFLDQTRASWMGRYEKYKGIYDTVTDTDGLYEEFNDLLDDAFVDPRNIDPMEWKKLVDRQYDMRQLALKDLIVKGDEHAQGMDKRIEKVQDLAKQVDETVNEKDAADLANRLLTEILLVLQEMLAHDVQANSTMAALSYEGVTEDSIKARQETLKGLETDYSRFRYEVQLTEQMGITEDDNIVDVLDKAMGE